MKKAFTLIELLIVIAIIAILAAILFVSIGQSPLQKSRDTKRLSDLSAIQTALTLYYTTNQAYPTLAQFVASAAASDFLVGSYGIVTLPSDPSADNTDGTKCAGFTGGPQPFGDNDPLVTEYGYRYLRSANGQAYILSSCLEDLSSSSLRGDCDAANLGGDATMDCFDDQDGSGASGLTVYDLAG